MNENQRPKSKCPFEMNENMAADLVLSLHW